MSEELKPCRHRTGECEADGGCKNLRTPSPEVARLTERVAELQPFADRATMLGAEVAELRAKLAEAEKERDAEWFVKVSNEWAVKYDAMEAKLHAYESATPDSPEGREAFIAIRQVLALAKGADWTGRLDVIECIVRAQSVLIGELGKALDRAGQSCGRGELQKAWDTILVALSLIPRTTEKPSEGQEEGK